MLHEPEFEPAGPTVPRNAQVTRRLQRIIASTRIDPQEEGTTKSDVPLPRKQTAEELRMQARQQLDALLTGPVQDNYVIDCAESWFQALDGEERVAILLLFWNKVGKPRRRIILHNVPSALRESLDTKNFIRGGIVTIEEPVAS